MDDYSSLAARYRFQRAYGTEQFRVPAAHALTMARHDDKPRYSGARSNPFKAESIHNGTRGRWIENTADSGLREAGAVDSDYGRGYSYNFGLTTREHAGGWYMDSHQSETVCGMVFQLPSRNGCSRYVPAYSDTNNPEAAWIAFGDVYQTAEGEDGRDSRALRECARRANRIAEQHAEECREYDSAWQAGARYSDIGDDMRETRAQVKSLLAETRGASFSPTVCQTLKAAVRGMLRDLQRARDTRAKLRKGEATTRDYSDGWYTGDARLREAFNEGACAQVLP